MTTEEINVTVKVLVKTALEDVATELYKLHARGEKPTNLDYEYLLRQVEFVQKGIDQL